MNVRRRGVDFERWVRRRQMPSGMMKMMRARRVSKLRDQLNVRDLRGMDHGVSTDVFSR